MENTLAVAKELSKMYKDMYDKDIDEMKAHKLLYFSQREAYLRNGAPLFEDDFCAWKYGPVLLSVRREFSKPVPFQNIEGGVSDETRELLMFVLKHYGRVSSWRLSIMSHEEFSWKQAREGLEPSENGTNKLSPKAIMVDAVRERMRRRRNEIVHSREE